MYLQLLYESGIHDLSDEDKFGDYQCPTCNVSGTIRTDVTGLSQLHEKITENEELIKDLICAHCDSKSMYVVAYQGGLVELWCKNDAVPSYVDECMNGHVWAAPQPN